MGLDLHKDGPRFLSFFLFFSLHALFPFLLTLGYLSLLIPPFWPFMDRLLGSLHLAASFAQLFLEDRKMRRMEC